MNNMDTGTSELSNIPLSSTEAFHFSAPMETHSTTATDTSAANMSSSEGGLASNNTSAVEDEMFSTPDNHGSIPVIQPLSQSPHVPGKTPHAVMTQSKLFTATSATDDATTATDDATTATVTQSPDVDVAKINDTLSQTAASDAVTKVKDNVNAINKTDTVQQDVEHSVERTTEQLSLDSVGVVKKENVDVGTGATAVSNGGKVDKDLVTTTVTTDRGSSDISGTTYIQLDVAAVVKGIYTHTYVRTYLKIKFVADCIAVDERCKMIIL